MYILFQILSVQLELASLDKMLVEYQLCHFQDKKIHMGQTTIFLR